MPWSALAPSKSTGSAFSIRYVRALSAQTVLATVQTYQKGSLQTYEPP
jgi:hypothetical protein